MILGKNFPKNRLKKHGDLFCSCFKSIIMFKLKYLILFFRIVKFKIKFPKRLKIKSLRIGFEEKIKIIIKGQTSFILLNKNVYLMRNGNIEAYDGGKIKIGSNVSINKNFSIVSRDKIKIGNNVSIGPNCCIYDHDHQFNDNLINIRDQGYETKEIKIGNNVWIASNVFIGKGVKIGDGSVIGSGSVVVKDIDKHTVVGGVPAGFIKNII